MNDFYWNYCMHNLLKDSSVEQKSENSTKNTFPENCPLTQKDHNFISHKDQGDEKFSHDPSHKHTELQEHQGKNIKLM